MSYDVITIPHDALQKKERIYEKTFIEEEIERFENYTRRIFYVDKPMAIYEPGCLDEFIKSDPTGLYFIVHLKPNEREKILDIFLIPLVESA